MKIRVHVREKLIVVQCGDGPQRLKWLGHVGIARYDTNNSGDLGVPVGVRTSTELFDMEKLIKDTFKDDEEVWIVLKGDTIPDEVTTRYVPPPAEQKPRPAPPSDPSSPSADSSSAPSSTSAPTDSSSAPTDSSSAPSSSSPPDPSSAPSDSSPPVPPS